MSASAVGGERPTNQFNGNISSVEWSNNLALGDLKSRGYKFAYDPLNRLNSASHFTKTNSWVSASGFHEKGITYDQNGNILTLQRTDAAGGFLDNLSYAYVGNRLRWVNDGGNRQKGFKEKSSASVDEYVYDNNGSMVRDFNKTSDDLLTNGDMASASGWTQSGVNSRLNFTNGNLEVSPGSGTATVSQNFS